MDTRRPTGDANPRGRCPVGELPCDLLVAEPSSSALLTSWSGMNSPAVP